MPTAALRYCARAGCPERVPQGYCRAHQTVRYREQQQTQGTAAARGYDADWRKVRDAALRRDKGLCLPCQRAGYTTPATEVDHIVSLADGGERLSLTNVQSICHDCHNVKTTQERRNRERITR